MRRHQGIHIRYCPSSLPHFESTLSSLSLVNVVIRLWRSSPALQIEWTGLGLLFHLCEPFAFLKRWRASVGRHGHGEALWGTCISVLRPLEISVVDIGSFINGNACILARGGIWSPPLPSLLPVVFGNPWRQFSKELHCIRHASGWCYGGRLS